jgi:hypothetical protein
MAIVINFGVASGDRIKFFKFVSPNSGADSTTTRLRKKKSAKKPKAPKPPNNELEAYKNIARYIAARLDIANNPAAVEAFVFTLSQQLADGQVNPDYFKKCKLVSAQTLESVPTSSTDPAPPPYGYRTGNNYPTVPVYPNGTPTASPAGYRGDKVGTEFMDTWLRWRKLEYTADAIKDSGGEMRVVVKWDSIITIQSSSRPSRPMFSLNMKAAICHETGSPLDSTEPPIMALTSLYWRLAIPPYSPPYYSDTAYRPIVKPLIKIAKHFGAGATKSYLLNVANRPMMGRGFNNNDWVETHLQNDPELWEVKKCLTAAGNTWQSMPAGNALYHQRVIWADELQLFVSVHAYGPANGVSTSTDGKTWAYRTSGNGLPLWSVCWAPEKSLFVAVGGTDSFAHILTSPNGINWTVRNSPLQGWWRAVAWSPSLNLFVALPYDTSFTSCITSPNGINWTAHALPILGLWRDVVWSPELAMFAAVASFSQGSYVITSADGINWNQPTASGVGSWSCIEWAPELNLFVALADWPTGSYMLTSSDGLSWTRSSHGHEYTYFDLAWSADQGRFIAVGSGTGAPITDSHMLTSTNGLTWGAESGAQNQSYGCIAWSIGLCRWVALTVGGPAIEGVYK